MQTALTVVWIGAFVIMYSLTTRELLQPRKYLPLVSPTSMRILALCMFGCTSALFLTCLWCMNG